MTPNSGFNLRRVAIINVFVDSYIAILWHCDCSNPGVRIKSLADILFLRKGLAWRLDDNRAQCPSMREELGPGQVPTT